MASVLDVYEIIRQMAEGFSDAVMECVAQHTDDAAIAVSEQLYSGIDGDGNYLNPTYDNDPYFNDPSSGKWFHDGDAYKEWKYTITPPEPGAKLGLSPRPSEVPNLWIDGTFHSTITASATPDTLTIEVRDIDARAIVAKYGDQILGLSPQGIGYFNAEFVEDAIVQHFTNCGW